MSMEEVNERFPLTKYKAWRAAREKQGLSTAGGVDMNTANAASRPASVRDADGTIESSRDRTADENRPPNDQSPADVAQASTQRELGSVEDREKAQAQENEALARTQTTASTITRDPKTNQTDGNDEDEDDPINAAVPAEMLNTPGDACAICIDTIEEDDDIRGLTCGHAFHAGCLDPWLTSRRACCPLCKADFYVQKPRPEGEERGRGRTPQHPQPAWIAERGFPFRPRLIFPPPRTDVDRRGPLARSAMTRSNRAAGGGDEAAAQAGEGQRDRSRWRRLNPFRNMPRFRPSEPRSREADQQPRQAANTTPAELEAGTASAAR